MPALPVSSGFRRTALRSTCVAFACQALRKELEFSAQTKGVPGTDLAFNDGPEK